MADLPPFDLDVVDRLLTTTRAVRKRLDPDRAVPRELVEQCLHLAFQAPTGANAQNWIWVVVADNDLKKAAADLYRAGLVQVMDEQAAGVVRPNASGFDRSRTSVTRNLIAIEHLAEHLEQVPYLLVPAYEPRYREGTTFAEAVHWGSILPAVWSFMLALRARGLGSAWTTAHLRFEHEMGALLGIPERYVQAGLFPVAYTLGTDFRPANREYSEHTIYWDRWSEH
jgi:nitroreductase